jgi:anti-anti-sigma regulatory factor
MRETVVVDQPNTRRDSEWLIPLDLGPGLLASAEAVAMDAVSANFENWDRTPSGGILTIVGPDQTVVRLDGEIDLSMAGEFARLIASLPSATAELVLDVSALTFCDSTLADFLAVMLRHMPVTVTRPNPWLREFLALIGLADQVRIVEDAIQFGVDHPTTLAMPA